MELQHIPLKINGVDFTAELVEKNNKDHVSIRPICEAIGVALTNQIKKLKKDPKFSYVFSNITGKDGKNYEMVTIPVEEVGMWLCSINSNKIKESAREVLFQFQKRCQVELHEAITGRAGIQKVQQLENRIYNLEKQIEVLTEAQRISNQTIERLQNEIDTYNDSERMLSSVGGKMMARARKTKNLRSIH